MRPSNNKVRFSISKKSDHNSFDFRNDGIFFIRNILMKQYQIKKAPLIRPVTRVSEPSHCCCQRPSAISQPRFGTSGLQSFDAFPNMHQCHHMQPAFQPAGTFQPQAFYQPSTMMRTVQYPPIAPSYQVAPSPTVTVQQVPPSRPRTRVEYVVMPKGDAPPNVKSAN